MQNLMILFGVVLALIVGIYIYIENNKYSDTLIAIEGSLLLVGVYLLYKGHYVWGMVFTLPSALLITLNLKGPISNTEGASQKVWLLTFRGAPTEEIVESTTLVLEKPIPVVGHIEFDTKMEEIDFPLSKMVFCLGDRAYIEGKVAAGIRIDWHDDPPGTPNWKSGGQKLKDFATAGGMEEFKELLDEICTLLIEVGFASHVDSEWMETNNAAVSFWVLNEIMNGRFPTPTRTRNLLNGLNWGIIFDKFEVILQAPEEVRKARITAAAEIPERQGDTAETATINQQIFDRMNLFRQQYPNHPMPHFNEFRNQILEERGMSAGVLTQLRTTGTGGAAVMPIIQQQPAGVI